MKNAVKFLWIIIFSISSVYAQVYNGDLTLTFQTAVDTFNYAEINGDLTIKGADITNLDSLEILSKVKGLEIFQNPQLTDISGLGNLIEITNLNVTENALLTNLDGLENCTQLVNLHLFSNPLLSDISALANVKEVDYLGLQSDAALLNLNGLHNLEKVYYVSINNLKNLQSLSGLESLRTAWQIWISSNPKLANIDALLGIQELEQLWIFSNASLKSLYGCSNLQQAGVMGIGNNDNLTSLNGLNRVARIDTLRLYSHDNITTLDALSGVTQMNLATISSNPALSEFCGLFQAATNGMDSLLTEGNAVNPTLQDILDQGKCPDGQIDCIVWHDENENGIAEVYEKGLQDITVRLKDQSYTTKHATNANGQTEFSYLPYSTFSVCVDITDLPTGIRCTTGEFCSQVNVSENNRQLTARFGLTGNGLDAYAGVPVNTPESDIPLQPNQLLFVNGSPTYNSVKYDYSWQNAVDGSFDSNDGTTWALGQNKPWVIYEFADKGYYKFNYIKFQTGNGETSKLVYPLSEFEVWTSTTDTSASAFTLLGKFRCTYGTDKMQWSRTGDYVTAKYIKIIFLTPVVNGRYTQLVEFAVDTENKQGPIPTVPTASAATGEEESQLLTAYPNPFNPTVTIKYHIKQETHVALTIINLSGQQVSELVNQNQAAGFYEISWDGSGMPSGVYFIRMQAGSRKQIKKIILRK